MDDQQGPTYNTGNSVQCYAAARMGEEVGGEWIHIYVWLSPFDIHLKLSQHCLLIGYTPVQKIKRLKKKKGFRASSVGGMGSIPV